MNAIKRAIVDMVEKDKKDVRTITVQDVSEKLTLERNAGITLKEGEDFPPSLIVSEVEFDSSMASVMHRVQREEAQAAAIKKAAEGSVK